MAEIQSGLTNDSEENLRYLAKKCSEYKDDELSYEIIRECGRMMYDYLPEKNRQAYAKSVQKDDAWIEKALEDAKQYTCNKDYGKALELIEGVVKKIEALNRYTDDSVSEYRIFSDKFEEKLYRFYFNPQRTVRTPNIPYTELYGLYADLLFESGRYSESMTALGKGLQWDPVDFDLTAEYIDCLKATGNIEQFYTQTLNTFKIAYKPEQIALLFRNLGYYFFEKGLFSVSYACYIKSAACKESAVAELRMQNIETITGGQTDAPSLEMFEQYSSAYGFPTVADEAVINLMLDCAMHYLDLDQFVSAKYYFELYYELSHDEEIKETIDMINRMTT